MDGHTMGLRWTCGPLVCCYTLWFMAPCHLMETATRHWSSRLALETTGNQLIPPVSLSDERFYIVHITLYWCICFIYQVFFNEHKIIRYFLFLSDACGLIRWMLMVNPERRAKIEEIAGHWWLNWGYQQPLLSEAKSSTVDQTSSPISPATSQPAGLASVASWLRRTSRPLLENGSKMRCLLRSQGGGGEVVRQRSLRRSRKENNVSQTVHEESTDCRPSKGNADSRPSKGILKRRNSVKQKVMSETPAAVPVETEDILGLSAPTNATSATLLPRKGILKKPTEQESGYYSSSPENSDSGWVPQTIECPSAPTSRKGILKRNGKFSSGGMHEFGSLDQLAVSLPHGGARSRPNGAISEDSILSSESFDQLDLPDCVGPPKQMNKPAKASMRGCVSADNLLDIQEDRILGDGLLRPWSCYESGMADSAFSITDCDNVTEAYKQAMVIRGSAVS